MGSQSANQQKLQETIKQKPQQKGSTTKVTIKTDYFERKLDDKRRLTIPVELRPEFASGVVVTRGFGKYLHLYPKTVWDEQMETALLGSILDEKVADLNVQFRSGKVEAELDQKQGRITFEQHHIEYAGIDREVVAVRAGQYWRVTAA